MNATATKTTFAEDIAEMMAVWNKIEANAREAFPNATKEELFQICKRAMNKSLGFTA